MSESTEQRRKWRAEAIEREMTGKHPDVVDLWRITTPDLQTYYRVFGALDEEPVLLSLRSDAARSIGYNVERVRAHVVEREGC